MFGLYSTDNLIVWKDKFENIYPQHLPDVLASEELELELQNVLVK